MKTYSYNILVEEPTPTRTIKAANLTQALTRLIIQGTKETGGLLCQPARIAAFIKARLYRHTTRDTSITIRGKYQGRPCKFILFEPLFSPHVHSVTVRLVNKANWPVINANILRGE